MKSFKVKVETEFHDEVFIEDAIENGNITFVVRCGSIYLYYVNNGLENPRMIVGTSLHDSCCGRYESILRFSMGKNSRYYIADKFTDIFLNCSETVHFFNSCTTQAQAVIQRYTERICNRLNEELSNDGMCESFDLEIKE